MICIPIIAKNSDEALEKMARANTLADVLEIRLDMMDAFDLHEIIRVACKPVLVTYRSQDQGGKGSADPETHADHILTAIQEGADLVDVELSLPPKWQERIFDARGRSGIVISTHINHGTPSQQDLEKIFRECTATRADIVKIVTRAEAWADNLRVLELIPKAHGMGIKIIAFCMGSMGRISRVFSHLMGGYLTFASLEQGEESADGQMTVMETKKILNILVP
ncbi:MAG TPA: type I 3-dehydroquinate dehydratase [Thermodesulfobacteriota bacterium]|nr:type I 3-dehydroquinate dehydratase [Thermodesulfobacteriota bacterium]